MDGLLVDSEPIWHQVEIDVFGRHGVPLTVERCLETKGMFLGDAVEHWYARYPWSGPSRQAVGRDRGRDGEAARQGGGVEARRPPRARLLPAPRGAPGGGVVVPASTDRRRAAQVRPRPTLR